MTSVFGAGSGLSRNAIGALLTPPVRGGGVVYFPEYSQGAFIGTNAMVADTLYTAPVFISNPGNVAFRGLQILAGTAVAAVLGRMMLYRADAQGNPGALIANTAADVDMNTGAATPLSADFAADQVLPTGLYFPAVVFNGLAQPWSFNPGATMGNGISARLGVTDLRGVVAAGNAARIVSRITGTATFGTAPATFPAATYGTSNPGSPLLGMVTR